MHNMVSSVYQQQIKSCSKPTILVVDDDPAMRLVQTEKLKLLNCDYLIAESGEQALKLYPRAELILLDIDLPGITGLEVCRYIRQQSNGKDLPIVAVTGFVNYRTKEQCYSAGMDFFLTKPVSLFELCCVLYYWLPDHRAAIQRVVSHSR